MEALSRFNRRDAVRAAQADVPAKRKDKTFAIRTRERVFHPQPCLYLHALLDYAHMIHKSRKVRTELVKDAFVEAFAAPAPIARRDASPILDFLRNRSNSLLRTDSTDGITVGYGCDPSFRRR